MDEPNAAQITFWNGPAGAKWAAMQEAMDRSLARVSEALFACAAPAPGERVLDVGCGCGTTTLELARRTGAAVVGVDVSAPMLAVARARAVSGVTFVEDDAATHAFDAAFDLVFSRMGVMFFADPVAAFANLRRATAPGGRLVFACFRALADNAWARVPLDAARGILEIKPAEPGAPGPFAFADGERLREVLAAAGYRDIRIDPIDPRMHMGATLEGAVDRALEVGPLSRAAADADEPTRAKIRERVAAALAPHVRPDGIDLGMAVWLVQAKA